MPITIAGITGIIGTIGKILGVVGLFQGPGKIDKEAEVAAVIQAVQDEVGLTIDIKYAWNWFDNRYIDELGPTYYDEDWSIAEYEGHLGTRPSDYRPWKPYTHYAGHSLQIWDDIGWWKDMCSDILNLIQHHLNKVAALAPVEALPAFLDKLKKYAPWIALGGVGVGFAIFMIAKASKK